MIEVKDVSKSFGRVQALRNITINFERGKVYGLIGPNGAGKTTFFECLAGLMDYSGSIDYSQHDIRNHIAYLPTNPTFLTLITGKEHLQLLCNARRVTKPNFRISNIFNLPLNRFVTSYSTGMKKKLAFTAILMQKNELFLLDEPFNGVDIQSNILLTEIIHRLKQANKTVIISSHILSSLSSVCDNFILLKEGKIHKIVGKDAFNELEADLIKNEVSNKLEHLIIR
ncbi:MAG: ATP-binding cassette domain-containing protein [Candidatus Zophobacter franzmannii]|jgi:ABC-2 type transport system ATP-binding protein|nr:ATP-binding cassette domain-containing protein [Candidatus Zophobacter franzmannii]